MVAASETTNTMDTMETGTSSHVSEEKRTATADSKQDGEMLAMVDPDAGLSPEEIALADRKLVRKLDWHLIPILSYLYLLSFLDRTNIGNAKLDGLTQDLHLTSGKYNACLTIFFVSYSVFEPLTNICLKRFNPSRFLPLIIILWGMCMTLMGLCHNFSGMVACRWFLGLTEAGLFPGVNYYLSCWYKRNEFGLRAAIFFSAAALSGSFGGLLAAAIGKMAGIGGKPGWAWIFILEGLLTVVSGVASFWLVENFPDKARFLNDADRYRVLRRLKEDKQAAAGHEGFDKKFLFAAIRDWKMYLGMAIYCGCAMPLYAFSLFLPTIITGLKISEHTAINQLLTVPPYAVAAVATIFIGWVADRTRQRGLCNIGTSLLAIVGFALLASHPSYHAQYAGVFLGALGIYPCISNTISWVSNNIEGVYKRGVVIGFVIGWGNLNGVVSSNIFMAKDAKNGYRTGHGIILGYLILFLFGGSVLMHVLLRRENARRRAGARDSWTSGKTAVEIEALGDTRPDFFYTV